MGLDHIELNQQNYEDLTLNEQALRGGHMILHGNLHAQKKGDIPTGNQR